MALEQKPEFNKKQNVQQGSFEDTPGFLPKDQTKAEQELIEKIKNFAKEYGVDEHRVTVGTEGGFLIDGKTLAVYMREGFVNSPDVDDLYDDSKEWKREHPFG